MSRPKEKDATLDWFLIANSDNLSIKIRGAITVGQDDNGVLVLNSPVEAQRWLTLTVDPAGHLVVTEQDPKCKLECPGKWLAHSVGATVPRGSPPS